jgi:hypothetical protein
MLNWRVKPRRNVLPEAIEAAERKKEEAAARMAAARAAAAERQQEAAAKRAEREARAKEEAEKAAALKAEAAAAQKQKLEAATAARREALEKRKAALAEAKAAKAASAPAAGVRPASAPAVSASTAAPSSQPSSSNPSAVLLEWCRATGHSPKDILVKMQKQAANKVCFDSGRADNTWCSVPFGIFLSYDCSSDHRNMGVHVSFVQSVKLDKWTQENILKMLVGGNAKAKAFFRQHGYDGKMDVDAKQRYGGAAGKRYKKKVAEDASNAQVVHDCLHALFPNETEQPKEDDFFAAMGATPAAPAASQQQSIGERRAAAAAAKAEALAAASQRRQEAELAAAEAAKERVDAAAAAMTADADAGWDAPAPSAKPKTKIRMGAKKGGKSATATRNDPAAVITASPPKACTWARLTLAR